MFANLNGWHVVILLAIVLLLFGAPKLPGLAKSLGQSAKILKKELRPEDKAAAAAEAESDETPDATSSTTATDVKSTPKS